LAIPRNQRYSWLYLGSLVNVCSSSLIKGITHGSPSSVRYAEIWENVFKKLKYSNTPIVRNYDLSLPVVRHQKLTGVEGMGRDSSVGIATSLRAGRSGNRISVVAKFSAPVQTGLGAHTAS
jgi:hypothetical protein